MYEFSKIPTSAIEQVIMTPVFGADLSTRLWRQDMDTGFKIRQSLNEMFITGQPPQKFADDLQKIIGARDKSGNLTGKKYEAYRVLYSEGAQALSQSQLQAYIDDDMEYYQIIATLDNKTSEICRSLDGCIFSVTKGGDVPQKYVKGDNEYQRRAYDAKSVISGINFPIFHPNCRTTTAVYIPNLKESKRTRMARNENGKSARVKDMTYQEWYNERTENKGEYLETLDKVFPHDTKEQVALKERFDNEISILPQHHQELVENSVTQVIISNDKPSGYNPEKNILRINKNFSEGHMIHEAGHIVSEKCGVYDDPKFRDILNKNFSHIPVNDIIVDTDKEHEIFRVESEKFVSVYQGRIYERIGICDGDTVNLLSMREYFSEGYREYFTNKANLKSCDPDLFNYIEGMVKDDL